MKKVLLLTIATLLAFSSSLVFAEVTRLEREDAESVYVYLETTKMPDKVLRFTLGQIDSQISEIGDQMAYLQAQEAILEERKAKALEIE